MHTMRWVVAVVLTVTIAACGRLHPAEPGPPPSPPPAAMAPKAPPAGQEHDSLQLQVTGTPMPGCFAADEPFQAIVRGQWGQLGSMNTLTHRWSPPPTGQDGVVVRIDGQDLMRRLDPGDALPLVNVFFPMGDKRAKVKLSTFVFVDFDDQGRACFRWQNPPGQQPDYEIEPGSNTET